MNRHNPPAGAIRASLRHSAFRWLLGGLAVSQIGDCQYNLAHFQCIEQQASSSTTVTNTTGIRQMGLSINDTAPDFEASGGSALDEAQVMFGEWKPPSPPSASSPRRGEQCVPVS